MFSYSFTIYFCLFIFVLDFFSIKAFEESFNFLASMLFEKKTHQDLILSVVFLGCDRHIPTPFVTPPPPFSVFSHWFYLSPGELFHVKGPLRGSMVLSHLKFHRCFLLGLLSLDILSFFIKIKAFMSSMIETPIRSEDPVHVQRCLLCSV